MAVSGTQQSAGLKQVKQVIAVHSAKGGVGKSTMSVNLAVSLAMKGAKVGLIDADVHGPSGSLMMGNADWPDPGPGENTIIPLEAHGVRFISMGNITNRNTPLIWRGAMVHSVLTQFLNNVVWGELDYLFIDMPPGTGDAQLSLSQGVPLTGAVVISTPQELSLTDSIRGIKAFQQLRVPILGLIENMSYFVCDGCGDRAFLFGESGAEILADELGFPCLGRIPLEPGVCDGSDQGKPFVQFQTDSASARAMEGVVTKLVEQLESINPGDSFELVWQDLNWNTRYPDPPMEGLGDAFPLKAVWQVSSDELGLQWDDGHVTLFSVRELRLACPCAACIDEWTGEAILKPETVAGDISLKSLQSVGRYAINLRFSDGHNSGIYHFARLKAMAEQKSKS